VIAAAAVARGQDADNCLLCHQYRGLGRYDPQGDRLHLFYVDPDYVRHLKGAHARLACTACHPRDEVAVIPHRPVSRVDCTRTCHLQEAGGVARRFSHANVAAVLEQSVHAAERLTGLSLSAGPLLDDQQSKCLYCHDEPVFREAALLRRSAREAGGLGLDRCESCHREQVATDVAYYLRHIGARLQPARLPLEQAQSCAVCHAAPAFLEGRSIHNAVASFVRSFHGKAALLGEESTPDCRACHVARGDDAHRILSRDDPSSSVSAVRVADTCRSVACHPGADARIASAGVHLDLPSARGTLEYGLAVAFIVLTVLTFGPSLVLCLLELGQIVVGRHHGAGPAMQALVRAVLAHPAGRARLIRFTVSQRVQHWVLAVLFVLLALTGFPMKFADQAWSRTVIDMFGGLGPARNVHHWAGLALIAGLIVHAVYALTVTLRQRGQPTGVTQPTGWRALLQMPMLITPADLRKAGQLLLYLTGLRSDPPTFGRFTIKEKFEYLGVFWGTVLLGLTGIVLWQEEMFAGWIGGRGMNVALILHTYEAFLAIIHVGILHIVNVVFSPNVVPLSLATITGDTPVRELAEQHGEMVAQAAQELGIPQPTGVAHG
jgi:cytochrome b subunit of formate dehydrogenase